MIIEDQESFKSWLSAVLEPLCDADPVALAKYVFALVKKDKPPGELRAIMIEQLDVFLQQETKNFVDLLFKTLETQAYSLQGRSAVVSPPVPQETPATVQTHQPMQLCVVQESQPITNHQVTAAQTNGIVAVSLQRREADSSSRPVHRKSDSDKEEKSRRRHRSSTSPPPSRGRSRSRSWERSRRSRSRGRERDRSRAWRNKSPPPGGSGSSRGRRRTWSRSPPPPSGGIRSRGASRSRSRSPRYNHRSSRYRNRSPPPRSSVSRSRSHSLDRSARDKKEPLSGAATPTQDSNHGDVDMRLTTTSQSIQSVVSACSKPAVPATAAGVAIPDNSASTPTFLPKRRCRDFDEKGYCMRGDLCPYDHGNDPVVLEDVALSRVLAFGPGAGTHTLPPTGTTPAAPEHVAPAPVTTLETHPPPSHNLRPPTAVRPTHMEYNPDAPSMEPRIMWGRQQFRSAPLGMRGGTVRGAVNRSVAYNPQPQRELISVPVTDEVGQQEQPQTQQQQQQQQQQHQHPEQQQAYQAAHYGKRNVTPVDQAREVAAKKKPGFDFNRLGPRHKNPNNCSLELKKVPRPLNNITHLNNHFSKFGKIVNIQVSYEGDPEAAIVTFSSHAEAYAAYRSTEAVLNNRFIKVFWHNSGTNNEAKQENVTPPRPSVKDRLGVAVVPSVAPSPTAVKVLDTLQLEQEPVEKVIMSGNNLTKTVYIPTALKKANVGTTAPTVVQENRVSVSRQKAAAAIKKTQDMLAVKEILKKKHEEKRKEAMKLTADLRKRKQELLEKQLAEQKSLIERLEKGVAPEQREALMATIKKLQETIEQIRKDLSSSVVPTVKSTSSLSAGGLTKKTVQEAQREILDAELDLFTRQQEGGDTSELQRRVAELKMAAHSLGLLRPAPRVARGAATLSHRSAVGRGRGRGYAHVSVDHRPTKVLVSGYEEDEKDDVVSHFAQFGEVVDYVVDESTPSLILNYKSRKEAELAILKGRTFQDRLLSVTWCGGGQPATTRLRSGSVSGSLMSTVHLHPGGGAHRQVVLVGGAGSDGGLDEPLADDEEEIGGAELSEDVLLQDDEEEEEDGEDRSWRR
ncbi:RNA-binding protein 26 isoform X1 [Schistocerca piceifrons]|uniref:RNA-binding protein 26 isoform X1 n=1 Tax=Schistocerca piceifrons TaxID=274613 RepID=UPI001F5F0270|nr:RNA-binding protein 26 isoform X1 [Schistocerca piceifrons]